MLKTPEKLNVWICKIQLLLSPMHTTTFHFSKNSEMIKLKVRGFWSFWLESKRLIYINFSLLQKELFSNKLDTGDAGRERKNSSSSTASMKNKWLKAFKSLKTPPPEEKWVQIRSLWWLWNFSLCILFSIMYAFVEW